MISIICGEDTIGSRQYLQELIASYQKKGYEPTRVIASELNNSLLDRASSPGLFQDKQIFIVENLNKAISRRTNKTLWDSLEHLAKSAAIELIVWEDSVSLRDLKTAKLGRVKEFKPGNTIFQLMEACYPSNLPHFLRLLRDLATPQNEVFLYLMMVRQTRLLVQVKQGTPASELQSWQRGKLQRQARHWTTPMLLSFYTKLLAIETGVKSGQNSYGFLKSMEILSCYCLRNSAS